MPFDLERALTSTPYPQKLAAAAVLVSESRYVEAAVLLEETLAGLEKAKVPFRVLAPFLELHANSLRNAAARFASSDPYSPSRVDLRVRIEYLEQALELYSRLKDIPSQVHTLVALGTVNLNVGEPVKAYHHFKQAFTLATPTLVFDIGEVRALFSHLADAFQEAFVHSVDHQLGLNYTLAVEGAAYRSLAGDPAQAMADLEKLHEHYLEAAKNVHRSHGDDVRAFKLLVQGIYWGLVTGHSDVLETNADLLVNYATQVGNADAIAVYDRSIELHQSGLHGEAQRLVVMQARKILAGHTGTLDLNLFHEIVDEGSEYQFEVADRVLRDGNLLDPRVSELAEAKRGAALVQLITWAQTLNAVVPAFSGLGDRKMLADFVSRGFKVSLQRANTVLGDATLQVGLHRLAMGAPQPPPMNPGLVRFMSEIQWQEPTSVQQAYTQLALTFRCTPAEVALVLSPRGVNTPVATRMRAQLGNYAFEQIRRTAITQGLQGQFRTWTEGRDVKGRR